MKFSASTNGYITGLRFYKGSTNTGTHVGHLWSSSGTMLAEVTFTSETSSGWQTVSLSTPVSISANQTYVVSYHTTAGHFSVDRNYFATARQSGPLHAYSDSEAGGNGVYIYGNAAFPTYSYGASNYWVDVIFSN
jgi:hypothetical protein